jgi:UDPglucose 6-dehydrogenase
MRTSIIGSGYVGLITGTCLAELGNEVILVDVIREKVDKINRGIAPIYEEGLDQMLHKNTGKGRLHASMNLEKAVLNSDVTFIAVGTPSRKDGSIDILHVKKVAEEIGKALKNKGAYHTVVVKSTVTPGTTEDVVVSILEKTSGKTAGRDFGVVMNPEFLREGKAIHDFMNPDRIVIGSIDERSGERVKQLYGKFRCPVIDTDPRTAEMIKYASNAFLATKISFANEIGNLCKRLGIDTNKVAEGMGLDSRIAREFLNSGIGYGGSCFPKDVKAIIAAGKARGVEMKLLESVDDVNSTQPLRILDVLRKRMPVLKGKTVAVLGLAFKGETDDIRHAPSLRIVPALLEKGASVRAYDPKATENFRKVHKKVTYCMHARDALEGADACLILAEWDEFRNLTDEDFEVMRGKLIIEGRQVLDPEKVTGFEGVCW